MLVLDTTGANTSLRLGGRFIHTSWVPKTNSKSDYLSSLVKINSGNLEVIELLILHFTVYLYIICQIF